MTRSSTRASRLAFSGPYGFDSVNTRGGSTKHDPPHSVLVGRVLFFGPAGGITQDPPYKNALTSRAHANRALAVWRERRPLHLRHRLHHRQRADVSGRGSRSAGGAL